MSGVSENTKRHRTYLLGALGGRITRRRNHGSIGGKTNGSQRPFLYSTQFLYKSFQSTQEPTQAILGHICAPPRPLTGVTAVLARAMEWVDNERLLLLEGPIDTGGLPLRPLRLVTLDGQSTLIATLSGDHPLYSYYFEE